MKLPEKYLPSLLIIIAAVVGSILIFYFKVDWGTHSISPSSSPSVNFNIMAKAPEGEVLENFPSWLVVDPNAKILNSVETGEPGGQNLVRTISASFETKISLNELAKLYENGFIKYGFKEERKEFPPNQLYLDASQKRADKFIGIKVLKRGELPSLVMVQFVFIEKPENFK